jgi:3-oxoacyl-[acyl-carrier-protein] synthase-3
MGTRLDRPFVAVPAMRSRASARKLADRAIRGALDHARIEPGDVDLLLNAGLYHDGNLGEPALAALIQDDVHINPDDPHAGGHGSFSFDIANGACGVLTAMQIADGFLRAGTIEHALIVASDADPGRRMADHFPYAATGAAVVCTWAEREKGFAGFCWEHDPDQAELFKSRVGFEGHRNRLRIEQEPDFGATASQWAAKAGCSAIATAGLRAADIDLVVANPLTEEFLAGLSVHLGLARDLFVSPDDPDPVHTAALLVGLAAAATQGRLAAAKHVLLISAGAGLVAGAAVLVQ